MSAAPDPPVALYVVPRAGDDLLGIPAALGALEAAGWQVVRLLVDARQEQEARQSAALLDALLVQLQQPMLLPGAPAPAPPATEESCTEMLLEALQVLRPAIIVTPSPQDDDPAFQQIGWCTRQAVERFAAEDGLAPSWWMWSTSAGVPHPNLLWPYATESMEPLRAAAARHRSRPGLERLLAARATVAALQSEVQEPFAERWLEMHLCGDLSWRPGPQRVLDPEAPLVDGPLGENLRTWLQSLPHGPAPQRGETGHELPEQPSPAAAAELPSEA